MLYVAYRYYYIIWEKMKTHTCLLTQTYIYINLGGIKCQKVEKVKWPPLLEHIITP